VLIPFSLLWIVMVAAIRTASLDGGIDRKYLLITLGVVVVIFLAVFFFGEQQTEEEPEQEAQPQGYAGGFPVPAMPAGGAVRGAAAGLTFGTGRTVSGASEEPAGSVDVVTSDRPGADDDDEAHEEEGS
jgi:NADH-quinone oxidoreductase subunit H